MTTNTRRVDDVFVVRAAGRKIMGDDRLVTSAHLDLMDVGVQDLGVDPDLTHPTLGAGYWVPIMIWVTQNEAENEEDSTQ